LRRGDSEPQSHRPPPDASLPRPRLVLRGSNQTASSATSARAKRENPPLQPARNETARSRYPLRGAQADAELGRELATVQSQPGDMPGGRVGGNRRPLRPLLGRPILLLERPPVRAPETLTPIRMRARLTRDAEAAPAVHPVGDEHFGRDPTRSVSTLADRSVDRSMLRVFLRFASAGYSRLLPVKKTRFCSMF
jgi:hypothetical protein